MMASTQPIQSSRAPDTRKITVAELLRILERIPEGFRDLHIVDSRGQYLEMLEDKDWKEPLLSLEKAATILQLA